MAVTRCPYGHFYDDAKYAVCPHCDETPAYANEAPPPATQLHSGQGNLAKKRLMEFVQSSAPEARDDKTISIYSAQNALNPVVGWLVCVEGGERGRDWRLHAGRNFIGRSLKMDICLPDDPAVHRDNHCSVIYEPKGQRFLLVPGDGALPLCNGALASGPVELNQMDRLEIGGSAFRFMPFCGEEFKW